MDELKWYIKIDGTYEKMPQPSEYEIELEDLDDETYRAISTGNLISNIISINWSKCKFRFDGLSHSEANDLLTKVSVNPINAKIENPVYSGGFVEAQFRCSKKAIKKMLTKTKSYSVSFNLVQTKKIAGM